MLDNLIDFIFLVCLVSSISVCGLVVGAIIITLCLTFYFILREDEEDEQNQ